MAVCVLAGGNVAWADDVPTPVYFNDFSSTTGLTIQGAGSFTTDADARFGQVFSNAASTSPRTNYLLLPNTVFSAFTDAGGKTAMTISFWVNAKNAGAANAYTYAPLFAAYSAAPNSSSGNGSPMICLQSRGLMQINNYGWCDFAPAQNKDGKNNVYNTNAWEAGEANYISGGNWLDDSNWHLYTMTLTASQATIYLDGVLKNQWNLDGSDGQYVSGMFTKSATNLTYVCLGGNQAWNLGDNDAAFMFDDFAVYDAALTPAQLFQIVAAKKGLTVETYDFSAANSTNSSQQCIYGSVVKINGTDCNVLSNTKLEMNDRFAGQVANSSNWNVYKSNNGLGTTIARKLGVLNLSANDYVSITFSGTAPTFIGASNISGKTSGTAVVSGELYKMTAAGNLELSVPKAATQDWTYIKSITILTSTPVLSKPTVTFNSMVESGGLYYPKYTFSSTDDGVTFYDGDGNDISSGYTFTSAGSQTVYAGKAGRTNSAKVSFSAANVGMILANTVNCKSVTGVIDYSTGKVSSSGRFDVIDSNNTSFWKQLVPGLEFSSTQWYLNTSNGIYAGSGNRTMSCSVLNSNRIATLKHYDYVISGEKYDYLTTSENSITIKRQNTNYDYLREYNLYVNPSEEVSVTIGTTGYSTFSSPVPLNFAGIDGLTAYVATTVAGGSVRLTSVETAPANTGLVLKGTASQEYNIPVTNAAVVPSSNLLVGCIVETTVAVDATSGFNNYVLVNNGGVPEFQSLADMGATIPAGKAFLQNGAYSADARSLSIVFDDDETTGLGRIENSESSIENSIFNLNGQKVAQPTKGLYIKNGKKVIVK